MFSCSFAGGFLPIITGAAQIHLFPEVFRGLFEKKSEAGACPPFRLLWCPPLPGSAPGMSAAICLGGFGKIIIAVSVSLFAFTTILGSLF